MCHSHGHMLGLPMYAKNASKNLQGDTTVRTILLSWAATTIKWTLAPHLHCAERVLTASLLDRLPATAVFNFQGGIHLCKVCNNRLKLKHAISQLSLFIISDGFPLLPGSGSFLQSYADLCHMGVPLRRVIFSGCSLQKTATPKVQ